MIRKLYLDDERIPKTDGWEIVRDYDEFVQNITDKGIPYLVSFDHDLGSNSDGTLKKTGVNCARWLCEYCQENGLPLPDWNVHSANNVGTENIISILTTYKKMFE